MSRYMLTTIDNPYNPFTQYDEWFAYDEHAGYYTCSYLARIQNTRDTMSDAEYEEERERAIDEIVAEDPFGIYYKISKNDPPIPNSLGPESDADT